MKIKSVSEGFNEWSEGKIKMNAFGQYSMWCCLFLFEIDLTFDSQDEKDLSS